METVYDYLHHILKSFETYELNDRELDIIKNIRNIINGCDFEPIDPWWQGFNGCISKICDNTYEIYGTWNINDNKLIITELPVGEWTSNYKEYLEKLLEDVPIRGKPDDKKTKKQPKHKFIHLNNQIKTLQSIF